MRQRFEQFLAHGLVAVGLLFWSGCGWNAGSPGTQVTHNHNHAGHTRHDGDDQAHTPSDDADNHSDATRGHTHIGPNGNRLIVLGEHQYHAELIIDPGQGIATVLLLDHIGRKPLPIAQQHVTLNLLAKGRPVQIRLAAYPLPTDAAPACSRFVGQDSILQEELPLRGRLNLVIDGKPYTGPLAQRDCDQRMFR